MERFYRVEKNGQGPYNTENSVVCHLTNKGIMAQGKAPAGYDDARPTPKADTKLAAFWDDCFNKSDYIFGFERFDDVFAWFNLAEEIEFFQAEGYKIAIYEAERVIKGNRQAVARKDSLKLVDTMDF